MSFTNRLPVVLIALTAFTPHAFAQTRFWLEFDDPESTAVCGTVNAANARFVIDAETSQFIKINDTDTVLADIVLDEFDNVLVAGEPRGLIAYRTDVDGLRGLWWITLVSGNAVELDEFTADVGDSGFRPSELGGTRCSPEPLLDNFDDIANDNIDGGDGLPGGLLGSLCGSGMVMGMAPVLAILTAFRLCSVTSKKRRYHLGENRDPTPTSISAHVVPR